MTKLNWERVNIEKAMRRYGSERVGSEREEYFPIGRPQILPRTGSSKTIGPDTNLPKFRFCPHCNAKLNEKNLDKHIQKVHPVIPARPNVAATKFVNCPECKARVGEAKLTKHLRKIHSTVILSVSNSPGPRTAEIRKAVKADLPSGRVDMAQNSRPGPPPTKKLQSFEPFATESFLTPFTDVQIRDWFFESVQPPVLNISTTGSGPFEEIELDRFFRKLGIKVSPIDGETEVLIVGRREWDDALIEELIAARRKQPLRVYSQEMFLAYCSLQVDPVSSAAIKERYTIGHPALEFFETRLSEDDSDLGVSGSETLSEEVPYLGVLNYYDYEVGLNGKDLSQRHKILVKVCRAQLPAELGKKYIAAWGEPASRERFQKLVHTIAGFYQYERTKETPSVFKLNDWDEDLQWLKERFYDGRFTFDWPKY